LLEVSQALLIGGIALLGDVDGVGMADEGIEYVAFDEFSPFDVLTAIRATWGEEEALIQALQAEGVSAVS
jgi:hypothetical protein